MGLFGFKKDVDKKVDTTVPQDPKVDNRKTEEVVSESTNDSVVDLVLKFYKSSKDALTPVKGVYGDPTYDIKSIDCHFDHINEAYVYSTGLILEVPKGHVAVISSRSNALMKNVYIHNACTRITSNYRGEVLIVFKSYTHRNFPQPFPVGEVVAQIHLEAIPEFVVEEVEQLTATERGSSAFGSTDITE